MLTGLKNRRRLFELLENLKDQLIEIPTGVMMIDIDYFKQYNDQYGHAAGDQYLSSLDQLFKGLEKEYHIQFFRYGGEEFTAFVWALNNKNYLN